MQLTTKNIAILAVLIFVLFVAYKGISTSIQTDKEKAVIQERAVVQQPTDFELQSQCSKSASTFVEKYYPGSIHNNNYSSTYGRCFIQIVTLEKIPQAVGYYYSSKVMDVNFGPAGKTYAEIYMTVPDDLKVLGVPDVCAGMRGIPCSVSLCNVAGNACSEDTGSKYFDFNRKIQTAFGL